MTYDPRIFGFGNLSIPATGLSTMIKNETGSVIAELTPVRADTSGNMALLDVSSELACLAVVGITTTDVPNMSFGNVSISGRLIDIDVIASFGDIMYIGKNGLLTNVKPTEGSGGFIAGDFIIRVGVIVKNESNPILKDLFLNITIVGQI